MADHESSLKFPEPEQLPKLGETVQCDGYTIELQQCSCCDPEKIPAGRPCYVLRKAGKVVAMGRSVPRMAERYGWESYVCKHDNYSTDQEGTVFCKDCGVNLWSPPEDQ